MAHGVQRHDLAARDGTRRARAGVGDACPSCAPPSPSGSRTSPSTCWRRIQGIVTHDQYVVAFLELMRLPLTQGCNPAGMMISRDKVLSKQILAYHRIPTARFRAAAAQPPLPRAAASRVPAVGESGDRGCVARHPQASIVHDTQKLRERVKSSTSEQLRRSRGKVRRRTRVVRRRARRRAADDLPLWELDSGALPEVMAGIATAR